MSLVIHYGIGDVPDSQDVSASEMTYIVSAGALNSTHSLSCLSYVPRGIATITGALKSRDLTTRHQIKQIATG